MPLLEKVQKALADRYAIEREIGRGGMATVYLAQDRKHDRQVAVKVLHPDLAASLGPDRFLREIKVAARLSHPHIVSLHDSGQAGEFLYYVMPYIEGESLRQRLNREKQLPLDEALEIARHVASALGYAHSTGVVHRDIKPENVMLHQGEAVVTDFGIAKAVTSAAGEHLTQTGSTVGTPAYMSPEQAGGEGEIDGRSDVYSLGCVLYEMLAGRHPFEATTPQAMLVKHLTQPVPSLRANRAGLPESVERTVAKALAKEPAERFATATEFAQALHSGSTPPGLSTVSQPVAAAKPAPVSKSIAVLPFADMSPQRDQEYFCEGIAEELINALMRIDELRVASRTSAFAFKGKSEDIREIGRKLQVEHVLEGSVRKAGTRLRITAQLLKVADGYQMWSERYDRELEDVFAIQDEIAQNIARALRVVMTDQAKAIVKPQTADVAAYDYYLRGRGFFHQWRKKSLLFARQMFTRAIEIDAGYALAYAGIADCCSSLYTWFDANETYREEAERTSLRALELDPDLAEAHEARGVALTVAKRWDEAKREFETAIKLSPKLFEAYYFYGRLCFLQGHLEEAGRWFAEAARVRPEDYQALSLLGTIYADLGRADDASAAFERSYQVIEKHVEMYPDDARAFYMGALDAVALRRLDQAETWVGRALAIDPEDPLILYNVGCVYARLGKSDQALDCLEQTVAHGGTGHRGWMRNDGDLTSLRGNPRFEAMVRDG
jgi:TolB-like protein/Flp pilus assembly protein TadD/tRNA A-37 threonylcarbamoyl transferase component Bud32